MIVNKQTLLKLAPIKNMLTDKRTAHGVSYGLSEAGYDIRIKQNIHFCENKVSNYTLENHHSLFVPLFSEGKFILASAIEEFDMPTNLVGIVHDKSTWARRGLSVFNTVIEPGWKGFLTLELVYHGNTDLFIPAGSGIAQVVFHKTTDTSQYTGKYQNQENKPVPAKESE